MTGRLRCLSKRAIWSDCRAPACSPAAIHAAVGDHRACRMHERLVLQAVYQPQPLSWCYASATLRCACCWLPWPRLRSPGALRLRTVGCRCAVWPPPPPLPQSLSSLHVRRRCLPPLCVVRMSLPLPACLLCSPLQDANACLPGMASQFTYHMHICTCVSQ